MAKRNATSELNDRNWDEEEEDEEAGEFVAAKKDILKQRNIIKAKRRSNISTASPGGGIFANFAGFSSTTNATTTTATTTPAATLTNSSMKPLLGVSKPTGAASSITGASAGSDESDSKLHVQLKKLNKSVLQWMQQHVAKDPYCILTPIFKDYEKYLKTIQDECKAKSDTKDTGSIPEAITEQETNLDSEKSKEEDQSKPDLKSSSSSSSSIWPNLSVTNPLLSSGSSSSSSSSGGTTTSTAQTSISTTPAFGGFNFKPADTQSTFSFASTLNTSNAVKGSNPDEEDEYVPPKAEVKEIKEEGSVYSKRCKLFYEKDKNWIDKGIGNLHVKPFQDKAQLIIRADTNLGNILLNIMLFPTMQLKRQGKNNVSLVCIPNPPLTKGGTENKPVPLLIRVKSGEEADDLLAQLNKHKHGTDSQENV
ncbi:nuclear pore complex protein Nup50 [Octopus sinensis]|uniref:Nuclear pore complex protein Nup50 n=1 Tax=Octopus sinensis TaxID=2607531 RepID=A0A6P7TP27_9MOLL|nr:nuclear pore complex protein Nup50 [Octopus sinensis]XP_036369242.1 nuclear pore complex protein Nup50 [Octopus sinensis]XP_036369243.1 nuclear pore complex protein Nup50 [Octopus sinensis]XP_036369244.1 nuclear pore complex protein Nup50 [Octopus sinensis]XP_036369245.1 nuclear pore complex protein Nup50 [Octopus sinensis]